MKTLEEISQTYAQHCMKLGDLVYKQRKLHQQAEEVIRAIELLDQEAYAIKKASAEPQNVQPSTTTAENTQQEQ